MRVKAALDGKHFDMMMGAIILGNLILIVIETNANAVCETSKDPLCDVPLWVRILNPFLLVIYTIELLARFYAYRGWLFYSSWNLLDVFVVVSGIVDFALSHQQSDEVPNLTVIRVFRILRLARTIRLLSHFPELYEMMRGFGSAMKAMFWGFTIIVLMLGLWSLLAVELVHPINQGIQHDSQWCVDAFSSVQKATLFFFQTLVAGDSWGLCTIPLVRENAATIFIFALALVSVQLGFTNLILAVIVEAAHQAKEKDYESRLRDKKKHEKDCMDEWRNVIEGLDEDKSGSISMDELRKGYKEQPEVSKILGLLDIEWSDLEALFRLMDTDGSGDVSYVEFFHCLRRAHSQDMRMYLMNVKLQISHITSLLTRQQAILKEGFARIDGAPTAPAVAHAPTQGMTVAGENIDKAKSIHSLGPSLWRSRGELAINLESLDLAVGQLLTGPSPRPTVIPAAQSTAPASAMHSALPTFVVAEHEDNNVPFAEHEDNNVPFAAPAVFDNAPFAEPEKEKEPKSALRAGSVLFCSSAETTEGEPSLKASLDKLRIELEQRLDEIAQTAAATAVTLAQNTKSLQALVVSCGANEGAPAVPDSAGNTVPTSPAFGGGGQPQPPAAVLGMVQAVMGQMIPTGSGRVPPSATATGRGHLASAGNHR